MRHYKSDPDISISNGTCYYAVNTEAKDDYIPCGNVGVGVDWTCCIAGDICLGSSACYHRHFDITYIAGCTDPDYKDSSCPSKGGFDKQQWVGLENCKYDTNIWAGCQELGDLPGFHPPTPCTCSKEVEVLTDKPVLDNIAQLPTGLGGSISWYTGMKPVVTTDTPVKTDTATKTVTSSSSNKPSSAGNPVTDPNAPLASTIFWNPSQSTSPPAQVSTTPSTVVPPSNQPDLSSSTPTGTNLSTAAQAGIGIGAGLGAIILGGLLYLIFFLRKRQGILRDNARAQSDLPTDPTDPSSSACTELAADELKRASELPGSPAASELPSPMSPQRSFRAYNPHLHGNYAQKSPGSQTRIDEEKTEDPLVSPLSPTAPSSMKAEKGSPNDNENDDAKKDPVTTGPVYELEG
ncbi:uncharacterized protein GGS22DRAFT_187777 [Annulohypoxylon maeteangense]|uniref:uncharacterized protein n=1 Tax=Annulohypoxylon maeteangense TaxID=1927788 RepID=UPI002008C751|nr:uncharacterized protein GGS22DRAFT_187777 [Annulohypoxylon maeteangense]KAI0885493.1 hypothetical protein GGS22DRAFT_187777 [Annulohypoxylon maeteangense]